MIDCGFDESGDKWSPRGNLLVVSTYIGATSHAKKLADKWKTVLRDFDVPYFHCKELWNKKSETFKGLSNTRRKKLLAALIELIKQYMSWGYSAFIDPDYYVSKTSPRFRSQWGSAYTFAIRLTILFFILQLEREKRTGETVNFLIEDGHVNANQAIDMMREFKAFPDLPIVIGNYGLGGKRNNPILQAADILAYASCQEFCNRPELMRKLKSRRSPEHFIINCNTEVIELMQKTVGDHFSRLKTARLLGHWPVTSSP